MRIDYGKSMLITMFERKVRICVPRSKTIEDVNAALFDARKLMCLTFYMYCEVTRSYSRETRDAIIRAGRYEGDARKYINNLQKTLDRRLSLMLEGTYKDVFRDYADVFYGEAHGDIDAMYKCAVQFLTENKVKNAEVAASCCVLHNMLYYSQLYFDSLMRNVAVQYGFDMKKCFIHWLPSDSIRWCEMLSEELGLNEVGEESTKSILYKQLSFFFERFADKMLNLEKMRSASREALEDVPEEIKKIIENG